MTQLVCNCAADLRLSFGICINRFSHDAVHIETYLHVYILSMT